MKTPQSSGLYTIKVWSKDKEITIRDVLIGDLWLCSGQSNMEYNVEKGIIDAREALPYCENKNIRFFFVQNATAEFPQDDFDGYWKVCDAESMRWFSSVGYFFGERLNAKLKTPIGLINSNWGGTPIETWIPEDNIEDIDRVKREAKYLKKSTGWDNTIGSTYNAMIHPLKQMKIAGVIWYQGESNSPNAYSYSELFVNLIHAWRDKFETDLPFYYVQIAPYRKYDIPFSAAIVREQQEKVQKLVGKTGMIVISDQVDNIFDIHPSNKSEVGVRLANFALSELYGIKTAKYKFITFKEQQIIDGNKIKIHFNNAESGIIIKGKSIVGLELAGNDMIFYKANGKIDKKTNTLIVEAKNVMNPQYVRYAFGNDIIGNLFGAFGLPAAPFRTDEILYKTN